MINEMVLTESPAARAGLADKTDVLDKVGKLAVLSDGIHVDRAGVAAFYDVDVETVKKLVQRHRDEFTVNGLTTVAADVFWGGMVSPQTKRPRGGASMVNLYTRRAVLLMGMLLRDSPVARQVRGYLLNVEERAEAPARDAAVLALAEHMKVLAARVEEITPAFKAQRAASDNAGGYLLHDVAKALGVTHHLLRPALVADGYLSVEHTPGGRALYRPTREAQGLFVADDHRTVHATPAGQALCERLYG
ncbi:hypothetical protein [Kitasatospora sp. MBT66]|uniref:hypothetical protein n=1 Tax=Kitasatospora sp. MBT66 TaxID=1444769 RepID=UPI00068FC7F7|nr:hypothetical protein [Kitasatospora sp. MBT66]